MRKSLAVLAASAIGVGALALASPAFADTPPTGAWANTFVIPTTITLSLSSSSTTITPVLGGTAFTQPNNGADFTNPAQVVTVGSNDAGGYTVSEALTTAFANGTHVIPDTAVKAWSPVQGQYMAYDSTGDGIQLMNVHGPSGNPLSDGGTMTNPGNGGAWADASGNDNFPAATGLTLPSSLVPGTYSASLTFQAVGA